MKEARNPFEVHGISHLSPSSINLFCSTPALWVLEKVLKRRSPVGCAAHRGTAAEEGIVAGLLDPKKSIEDCAALASAKFRTLTAMSGDPSKAKELAAVPLIVEQGIKELRPYGPPTHGQGKIEHRLEGLAVPVIGYFDVLWETLGIIIDIKTQLRLASEIKTGHARQVALYKAAVSDNLDARISYITDRKAATYKLENSREHVAALHKIALTIQRFLALSTDPQELVGLVAPDFDQYFWSDPMARQAGFETWNY